MRITVPTSRLFKVTTCLALAFGLVACGGGGGGGGGGSGGGGGGVLGGGSNGGSAAPSSYRFSGVVSGLDAGAQLKLKLNDSDALTVDANGPFSFVASVPSNGAYSVTVTQPIGQTCSVANFSGAGVTGDVSNINIACSTDAYAINGVVSGLASGAQLTLNNNGDDPLVVSANGKVSFAKRVARNGSYLVTVAAQPAGQTCTVGNGSGGGVTADVSSVSVTCAAITYRIEGSVRGLSPGAQVTLANNGADLQVVNTNGAFGFATPVAHNGSYAVTVGTQPVGQTCTVNNGSGAGVTSNVANVDVICSTQTYSIGGSVSSLAVGQQVTLNNNGADATTVTASGAFSFTTPVAHGGTYNVTVGTQPVGQTCTVINGAGSNVVSNIGNVSVVCSTSGYTIGGVVSGLAAGQTLTLRNRGADALVVTGTGAASQSFSFATPVVQDGGYAVTLSGQPCIVASGGGVATANVTTVSVRCDARPAYAYVALAGSDEIGQYDIGADGALAPMAAATVAAGTAPAAVAVDPTGRFAYAANLHSASVSQYDIGANGSLTPMAAPSVANGAGTGAWSIAVGPTGRYAYVANNNSNTISQYSIGNDGSLTALNPATVPTGAFPRSVAVDPTGRYAYVANDTGASVSQYVIGANGALSPMVTASVPAGSAYSVSVDPTGRFAYVANFSGNAVSQFAIGTDGSLSAIAPAVPTGLNPYSIALDPSGRYAYVPNANDHTVSQYTIDSSNGSLNVMAPDFVSAGRLPFAIAFDPTGRFTYVANSDDGSIFQYDVAPANGALAHKSSTGGALSVPQSIVTTYAR